MAQVQLKLDINKDQLAALPEEKLIILAKRLANQRGCFVVKHKTNGSYMLYRETPKTGVPQLHRNEPLGLRKTAFGMFRLVCTITGYRF